MDIYNSPNPKFRFSDGSEMSSRELGALFLESSNQHVELILDGLFRVNQLGKLLNLKNSVLDDPMPAKIYTIAMQVGALFSYPMRILNVPDSVIEGIFAGVTDSFLKLTKPDGKQIKPHDVIEANNLIGEFNGLFCEDIDKRTPIDKSNPAAEPPKTTRLFLSLIVLRYNGGGENGKAAVQNMNSRGFYHQTYADITKYIDELPAVPLMGLHKAGLTFVYE